MQLVIPSSLQYFASLVQSDEHFPLLEAAACVAHSADPELNVQDVLFEMDQLQLRLHHRVAADAPALQRLRVLNQFFFRDLNFGGNVNDYFACDNSYLHRVLATRRGIPVSLAVLWLELAASLRLEAYGVAFPGHFLIKVILVQGHVVLDPLSGRSFSREELAEQLEPFNQRSGLVDEFEVPLGLHLQAATPRDIIARMLLNLKEIHQTQQNWPLFIAVEDRLIVLQPDAWAEYRDRGLAWAEQGNWVRAVQDLEIYLAEAKHATDVDDIAELALAFRQEMRDH